jgi:uncharacterized protein YbjQ (UPF0145 family)
LRSLANRERAASDIQVVTLRTIVDPASVEQAILVSGDAVIATDYFKTFAAHLRGIIGGEIKSFETLMDRARREAILRMIDEARALGATEIWNVRLQSSNIASSAGKKGSVSVELFAFGTAIIRRQASR